MKNMKEFTMYAKNVNFHKVVLKQLQFIKNRFSFKKMNVAVIQKNSIC